MIRKIVWGIPIALVVLGLLILLFAHLQPAYTATVLASADTSCTPSRTLVRGHSSSRYGATLMVEFTDSRGNRETARVQYGSTNPNAIPKVGDQIPISRSLSGMAAYPNRDLIGLGGGAAGIGGLFLALYLLTMLKERMTERRRNHTH